MLDWLKPVLGEGYSEDIEKKVEEAIGKRFVSKTDFNAANAEKKALSTQIMERDKQLEELKKIDAASLQAEISRLQAENTQKDTDYKKQLAALEYDNAAAAYAGTLKFTSELARKAFISELKSKELKLDNGKLLGAEEFTKTMRQQNPTAFEPERAGGAGFSGKHPPASGEGNTNDRMNSFIRDSVTNKGVSISD